MPYPNLIKGTKMKPVLKGNFSVKREVSLEQAKETTLEDQFEKAALKRLGGSIAFVSKRKVMWDDRRVEKKRPK